MIGQRWVVNWTNDGCATNFGTPGSRTRLCRSARFAAAVDKVSLLRLLQNPATPTGSLPHLVSETLAEELRGAKEVTVLLASFARRSLWRAAAALLLKADAVVDVPALGAAVRAFEKSGHWQLALALIEEPHECLRRSEPVADSVRDVGAAAEERRRRKDEALQAWPVVEWQRVGTAALTACGRSREWRRGSQLLQMLQQKGLELSAVPFNAAMRYRNGKLGWEGNLVAIEDRRRMCRKSRSMGEVQSCGERLAWQAAISVVKAASPWLDVSPDSMSFNTAISACARAHEWQQSFALLFEMEALRISPTVWRGTLRSFSSSTGYGFVHNEELQRHYGRDVYVQQSQLPEGILCGARVIFTWTLNQRGQPQCKQLWPEDTTEADQMAMFQLLPLLFDFETCSALLWSYCPEIVCLQEVELHRPLEELGLSEYQTAQAQRPPGPHGLRLDGCLVAWRSERFQLLRQQAISFDDWLPPSQHSGHVALLLELRAASTASTARTAGRAAAPLLVATTHLACGEELEEQRVAQAKILLEAIDQFHAEQVVLCGDLNCTPNSRTHQVLAECYYSACQDLEALQGDDAPCTATNASVRAGEGFAEIIDYCFLNRPGAALRRWRPPSRQQLRCLLGATVSAPVPTLMRGGHWPSAARSRDLARSRRQVDAVSTRSTDSILGWNLSGRLCQMESQCLVPAGVYGPGGLQRSSRRTSHQCLCPQAEAPTLLQKIVDLLRCKPRELEACQIIRYQEGELFAAHGDFSTDGTRSSAGFIDGCRRATLFVYLNDVPRGGVTEHASRPAIDEKWLFATWLWSGERSADVEALQRIGRGYTHAWPESYDQLSADVALQLLQMIQSRRLAPDLLSFNSAMSSCRLAWTVVLQLLKTLQTEGLRPDVVSFNAALAAVASSGELRDWERALALSLLCQELLKAGLEPDLNTATAVARVCGHAGEWQRVFAFWQMTSVEPDGKLYGTLFLACEKGLQWQLAVQLFEEMRHSNALDSFTSPLVAPQAIRACATQNSWDLALWVLAECSQHGDPGPSAFLAAVDAVEADGLEWDSFESSGP
eukprot:g2291.t1